MARKATDELFENLDQDDEEAEIRQFVESLGASINKCLIYRRTTEGDWEYVGWCPPTSMSETFIQETYGGGLYSVKLSKDGRYVKARNVRIGQPLGATSGSGHPASNDNPVLEMQVSFLREQLNRQHEMLLKMIEAKQAGAGSGPSVNELVQGLAGLYQLGPKPSSDSSSGVLAATLEALSKGMELIQNLAPSGDGKVETFRLIRDIVPQVLEKLNAHRTPLERAELPAPQLAEAKLRQGLAYLKRKAAAGKDPGVWVDLVLENLEDWQPFIGILNQPFGSFLALDPELSQEPYRTWFETLYTDLREALRHPVDTGRTPGDPADAAGDAPAGPRGGHGARGKTKSDRAAGHAPGPG